MRDVKASVPKADEARWNAMLDEWRAALDRTGEDWGQLPAASGMLFVVLKALQAEVGSDYLAEMLEGIAGKVRAGEPITMKVKF